MRKLINLFNKETNMGLKYGWAAIILIIAWCVTPGFAIAIFLAGGWIHAAYNRTPVPVNNEDEEED